uniref:Uncharacterized protein n=1 Tax=Anguilla anguilla TaxID=7936 RepID=A0A0E9VRB6_ANGAN
MRLSRRGARAPDEAEKQEV